MADDEMGSTWNDHHANHVNESLTESVTLITSGFDDNDSCPENSKNCGVDLNIALKNRKDSSIHMNGGSESDDCVGKLPHCTKTEISESDNFGELSENRNSEITDEALDTETKQNEVETYGGLVDEPEPKDTEGDDQTDGKLESVTEADGKIADKSEADGNIDGESEADCKIAGESEADGNIDGESEADGRIAGESEADGNIDMMDGELVADGKIDGESEADGKIDGESEADGKIDDESAAADGNLHGKSAADDKIDGVSEADHADGKIDGKSDVDGKIDKAGEDGELSLPDEKEGNLEVQESVSKDDEVELAKDCVDDEMDQCVDVVNTNPEEENESMNVDPEDADIENESGDIVSELVESLHNSFAPSSPDEMVNDGLEGMAVYESHSLKCQQCGTTYNTSEEFQEHIVGHLVQNSLTGDQTDADGWATCPICAQMFPEFSLYEEHLRSHLNNDFMCSVCNKNFNERKDLEEHVNKIHNVDRPFKCSECGKMFRKSTFLSKHLQKVHGQEVGISCDFCSYIGLTVEDLNRHMRRTHPKKAAGRKRKRQFTCVVCSRIYFNRREFDLHKRQGHKPGKLEQPAAGELDSVNSASIDLATESTSTTVNSNDPKVDAISFVPKCTDDLNENSTASAAGDELPDISHALETEGDKMLLTSDAEQTVDDVTKQTVSDYTSDDEGTPSKRRKSRRISYLQTLTIGCQLCTGKFATDAEYKVHLKKKHDSFVNDYGEVVNITRLKKDIKRRQRKSSVSSSGEKKTPKRRDRVQELRDDSDVSSSPRDSPMSFDEESEDPTYEPDASSDEDYEPPKTVGRPKNEVTSPKTPCSQGRDVSTHPTVNPQDDPNMRSWNCTVCSLTFSKLLDLKEHVLKMHMKPIVIKGEFPKAAWECPYCAKTFVSKQCVEKHVRYYHSLKELMESYSKKPVLSSLTAMPCKVCGQVFLGDARLQAHVQKAHSTEPLRYNCHLCSESFKKIDDLFSHIRVVHENGTPAVPKVTSESHLTSANKSTEIKRSYFACAVCEEGFNKEGDLEDHILTIHRLSMAPNRREKKLYGCFLCEKRFAELNSVMLHLVFHHKQDEHDIMGGRRQQEAAREEEKNMHQCLICLEYFSKKKYLDKHVRQNNCSPVQQSRRPKQKRNLIVHEDGEKPLDCPRCSGKYWGKPYLYLHVIENHGNDALGEYMLKKKIEDAKNEEFNEGSEEDEPFPVALYTAGSEAPRRPPRGGFLPARLDGQSPNKLPLHNTSSRPKIPPKSNPSTPDVIDLTDDDPDDNKPTLGISASVRSSLPLRGRPPIGSANRSPQVSSDRQLLQRPGMHMTRPGHSGILQRPRAPAVSASRSVTGDMRPNQRIPVTPSHSTAAPPRQPTAVQPNQYSKVQQTQARHTSPAVTVNNFIPYPNKNRPNMTRQEIRPAGAVSSTMSAGLSGVSSRSRPVSASSGLQPKNTSSNLSQTSKSISSLLQSIANLTTLPKTSTPIKTTAVVDLTEDSDEEVVEISSLPPKAPV